MHLYPSEDHNTLLGVLRKVVVKLRYIFGGWTYTSEDIGEGNHEAPKYFRRLCWLAAEGHHKLPKQFR